MSEIGGDKENNLKVAISRDKGGQVQHDLGVEVVHTSATFEKEGTSQYLTVGIEDKKFELFGLKAQDQKIQSTKQHKQKAVISDGVVSVCCEDDSMAQIRILCLKANNGKPI